MSTDTTSSTGTSDGTTSTGTPGVAVDQDTEALTVTFVTDLSAPPARVWQVWEDPRQLERWWGPPTWPATFTAHELRPGGRSSYYMTGPDGERAHGWWDVRAVDPPRSFDFEDGFADAAGEPDPSMPTSLGEVTLEEASGGTRMTVRSTFGSAEQMQQLVAMGMVEGMTLCLGQLRELLGEDAEQQG